MKKKSFLLIVLSILTVFMLVSCKKTKIELTVTQKTVEIKVGETHLIKAETNDEKGLKYESSNVEVVTVSDKGLVTGVAKGETKVIVTSITDSKKTAEIIIIVKEEDVEVPEITLTLTTTTLKLNIDEEGIIVATTNDETGLNFKSKDDMIATVDENGKVKAVSVGTVLIEVSPKSLPTYIKNVTVTVNDPDIELPDALKVNGKESMFLGSTYVFSVNLDVDVTYESSDETIVTVDEDGLATALKAGAAEIKVNSENEEVLFAVHVVDDIVVSNSTEKLVIHNGKVYLAGTTHFNTLTDVVALYDEALTINLLEGTFSGEANFVHDVTLIGLNGNLVVDKLTFSGEKLTIEGVNFKENGQVILDGVKTFNFNNNTAEDILGSLIETIAKVGDVTVENNTFETVNETAIKLSMLSADSVVKINKNKINNSAVGIELALDVKMTRKGSITLYRNVIDNIEKAFLIDLGKSNNTGSYISYARFNEVTNYEIGIEAVNNGLFEWTLNFWEVKDLDYNKFINVPTEMLLGNFTDPKDIVSEKLYQPSRVYYFELFNPLDTIELGENHLYEFITLPYSAPNTIRWIVSKVGYVAIQGTGYLTPLQTGEIEIEAYPSSNRPLGVKMPIKISTLPGIHVTPSITKQGLEIGDTFKIDAVPFPYTIKDHVLSFETSNSAIATVDTNGNVTVVGAGEFTITAVLNSDNSVKETLYFESYTSLDDSNIIDFIISRQMQYSKLHEIEVYGAGFNFMSTHHESVARFLFGDVIVNNINEKGEVDYIPKSAGVRPGTKKDSEVAASMKFNEQNIEWIVIHETANTSPGSGALSHHNYLKNRSSSGELDYTSWHLTMDSEKLYHHIPYDEIAWHAGDGSSRTSYINTGIPATKNKASLTIDENGFYLVDGITTIVKAPLISGKIPTSAQIATAGIWATTIDGTYHIPKTRSATNSKGDEIGVLVLNGGNRSGIGIEMSVNQDGNIMKTWQRTAKHAASLLDEFNMPFTQLRYHNSYSDKICPQSMIRAGLTPLFEEIAKNELDLIQKFDNVKKIELITEHDEYIEETGIIKGTTNLSLTLDYEVVVTFNDNSKVSKTFNVYLPGLWK